MKKSVIASNVGGLTELIQDGKTGLIHRHGEVEHLASKISQLPDDTELRKKFREQGQTRPGFTLISDEKDERSKAPSTAASPKSPSTTDLYCFTAIATSKKSPRFAP